MADIHMFNDRDFATQLRAAGQTFDIGFPDFIERMLLSTRTLEIARIQCFNTQTQTSWQ